MWRTIRLPLMLIAYFGIVIFWIALKVTGLLNISWLVILLVGGVALLPVVGGCGSFIVLKLMGRLLIGWIWILVPLILGAIVIACAAIEEK